MKEKKLFQAMEGMVEMVDVLWRAIEAQGGNEKDLLHLMQIPDQIATLLIQDRRKKRSGS